MFIHRIRKFGTRTYNQEVINYENEQIFRIYIRNIPFTIDSTCETFKFDARLRYDFLGKVQMGLNNYTWIIKKIAFNYVLLIVVVDSKAKWGVEKILRMGWGVWALEVFSTPILYIVVCFLQTPIEHFFCRFV